MSGGARRCGTAETLVSSENGQRFNHSEPHELHILPIGLNSDRTDINVPAWTVNAPGSNTLQLIGVANFDAGGSSMFRRKQEREQAESLRSPANHPLTDSTFFFQVRSAASPHKY